MTFQDDIFLTVLRAKYTSGCWAKQLSDRQDNGDNIECDEKKFMLLIQWIGIMERYYYENYSTSTSSVTLAQFTITVPCSTWISVPATNGTVSLILNGVETDIVGDGVSTFATLMGTLLASAGVTIQVTSAINCAVGDATITATCLCNTTSITFVNTTVSGHTQTSVDYDGINIVVGVCTSFSNTIKKCLTVTQAEALLAKIKIMIGC